jgi:hypothetical protein
LLHIRTPSAPEAPAGNVEDGIGAPEVDFAGYTEDCLILGRIRLEGDRVSDLLNSQEEYLLRDVVVESLVDGRTTELDEVQIARDELIAVHAAGPRGNPARRTRTLAHPVAVRSGAFSIRGYLHALPGMEPLASALRRSPMIPLTDAWLEHLAAGVSRYSPLGTIVVNRDRADWITLIAEAEVRISAAEAEARARRLRGIEA